MNDLLKDPLDYKLRTMMRTAVADLPPAPPVEDIATTDLRVDMDHTNRGSQPWQMLLGAAAAVALVIGVVAIRGPRSEQEVRQSAPIPTSPQPTNGGEYWLPRELPAGWRIVDLVQGGSEVGNGYVGELGNTFVFERPSDRARIVVQLPPVTASEQDAYSPVPPDALTMGTWIADSSTIVWAGNPSYEVRASSSLDDEAAVRAALRRMVISFGANGLVAALAPDEVEWRLVESYVDAAGPSTWQASFVLSNLDGRQAQVIYEPVGPVPPLPVLLDAGIDLPVDPSTPTFTTPTSTGAMMLRDGVAFDVGGYGVMTDLTEVAGTILSSMTRADQLAWNVVRAQFASDLLASPSTFDAEALGVTLTVYNDGLLSGTCLQRGDASGCSPVVLGGQKPGAAAKSLAYQFVGDQVTIGLDDGSWAIAAVFPPNVALSPCGDDEATGTRVADMPFGDRQLALVLPGPGMDSYSCPIPSDTNEPVVIFGIRPFA